MEDNNRNSACIIGLGLMGGSLARDLAAAGFRITGYDANPVTTAAATDAGVLSATLPADLRGALDHDVVVIATPIRRIPGVLQQLSQQSGDPVLIMDLGSTKTAIVAAAEEYGLGAHFVGSHPLTGSERSGWSAARVGLFHNAVVFLCATQQTEPAALHLAKAFWASVGALPRVIDVEEHDARVAWISHLPQTVASALGIALHNRGFTSSDLGPGGRDMTRLTHSDAQMWLDILMTNRQALDQPLRETSALLSALRQALQAGSEEDILHFLRSASAFDPSSRATE